MSDSERICTERVGEANVGDPPIDPRPDQFGLGSRPIVFGIRQLDARGGARFGTLLAKPACARPRARRGSAPGSRAVARALRAAGRDADAREVVKVTCAQLEVRAG